MHHPEQRPQLRSEKLRGSETKVNARFLSFDDTQSQMLNPDLDEKKERICPKGYFLR